MPAKNNMPLNFTLRAVDKIGKTLDKVRSKFPQLGKAVRRLQTRFTLLKAKTEAFRKSMKKMGGNMKRVGKSMTASLTLPIGLAGAKIISTAVDFQKSMNRVGALTRTIIQGKVAPAFKALEEQAKTLGSTTAFSAREVADAMGFLAQAGFKTDEIMQSIGSTLNLAAASNTDLARTADIASNIMGAFKIEAKDMSRVADVLSLTTASANVDMEMLAESMKDAAPIAKQFGASLEETAALTGMLGNIGIQGSKAGTTLKAMFTRLSAPTPKANKLLKKLGLTIRKEGTTELKSMSDILSELAPKLKNLPKDTNLAVLSELFGLRGIAGGAELVSQAFEKGKDPIGTFTEILQKSQGTAQDMANTLMRGAPGAIKRFVSAFEGAALAIADSGLLEFFADVLDVMTKFFQRIKKTSPRLLKFITVIAGITAVIGPLIVVLGTLLIVIGAITAPIWIVIGVIAALAAVIAALIIWWQPIKEFFMGWGQLIFLLLGPIGLLAVAAINIIKYWEPIKAFFSSLWANIVDSFSTGIKSILSLIKLLPGGALIGGLAGMIGGVEPGGSLGAKVGAEDKIKDISSNRSIERTNNANVNVDFTNLPRGTKVQSESEGPLNLNLGFAGALQ